MKEVMLTVLPLILLLLGADVAFGQQGTPANVTVSTSAVAIITDVSLNPTTPTQDQNVDVNVNMKNVGNLALCALPKVNITNTTGDVIFKVEFGQMCFNPNIDVIFSNLSAWYTNGQPIGCGYNAKATARYQGTDNITRTTSEVSRAFCIVAKPSAVPSPGGGEAPPPETPTPTIVVTPPPEPCIKDRVNILGPELSRCILEERKLRNETFYVVPNTVAASAALGGRYALPTDPQVRAGLANSLEIKPVSIYEEAASQVLQRFKTVKTIILARGDLPVDSMAAVALAKAQNIPILLTDPKALPEATLNAIRLLEPTKVIVAGGEIAVSRAVLGELVQNWEVERVWGESRYETAVELASLIKDPEIVVVTDGNLPSVDAILVSAEYQAPLLYVNGETVPNAVRKYILDHRETSTGKEMKLVTVGVQKKALIEMQGLLTLPKFLVGVEAFSRLYQVIMGLIS